MNKKTLKINDSNFDSLVIIPKKTAVVLFSATWNAQSQSVRPIIEKTIDLYATKVTFYEMDMDENSIIPIAYGVRSLPTILFFSDGKLGDRHNGWVTRDSLIKKIDGIRTPDEIYKSAAAFSKRFAIGLTRRFGF